MERSTLYDVTVTSCFQLSVKKKGSAGIIVMSTVFRIEPIGFQQKMKIENGYQTAVSDLAFFNFEIVKNNLFFVFQSFQHLIFQKTGILVKEHISMNMRITFQVDIVKNGRVLPF